MRTSLFARRAFLPQCRQSPSSSPISTVFKPSRTAQTGTRPPTPTPLPRPRVQPPPRCPSQPIRRYHQNPYDDPRVRNAEPLFTNTQLKRAIRSPQTKTIVLISFGSAVIFYFYNLETVPVSGRTRFNCYSPASVREVGEAQAKMVMYELERQGGRVLPDWDARTRMVKRVMAKLIPFSGMKDENWEVHVIEDPGTANAFVLPGGKVFVYSGILPLVGNDSGLAAVLGHEIAHNLADHIGERMSASIGVNALMYSLILLSTAIGLGPFIMQIFGGGVMDIAFSRPMGRLQESEADYIGLMMMAEACYDPREAVSFWRRMNAAQKDAPPEWMSTHPSNQTRIEKITEWLPKALEKREESDCRSTTAFADLFNRARKKGFVIEY